ncbi:Protein tas [Planktothrix tepida]|uniref:Protein tas n=2 Tax=Planktothrix TaxID=54304 RepID=A0A1J1LL55_9CYAN|nr:MULTISPECIES: aldo/keto reductase [Planktothrix]CAD5951934.1 Protein tas [Planktothrix tepida]CAD5958796.1 Protein tas [Planktothrix pseudagardhii]CUR32660.1 Protein tas [Planktothrix tepida PCC 9214]
MKYNKLGDSDLQVSEICLGTMTYGQQNTREEAEKLLDYAVSQGVNFIDTSETYPFPNKAEKLGITEEYIGEWLIHQRRDSLIIATKVAGVTPLTWIRNGQNRIDSANVTEAVESSLRRLQTDYIDLYQIHWPDRYVPLFGDGDYDPKRERETIPITEQLEVFADLIQAGKIRYLGVSNETPWGVCEFCHIARQLNLPKIVSIQNGFSLMNRIFHIHLAEACRFNQVGLLAYNPLAFGFLTGKYLSGIPKDSRLDLFGGMYSRYDQNNIAAAAQSYADLAQQNGITPAQLALAYVRSRWFVTSTIVGATKIEQLQENLASVTVELDETILTEIDAIHRRYPNPAA